MRSWLPGSLRYDQSDGESRFLPWVILLGLLVGGTSYWSSNKEMLGLFGDDGIYAVVAKSLSEGEGYRLIKSAYCSRANQISLSLFLYSFLAMGTLSKVSREYWPFESCKPCIPHHEFYS